MNITSSGGKSPFFEKALRWLLLGGIAYGGMKLINWITPFILKSVGNMVALSITAALVGLFILNFTTIKLWYFGFCKKITRWIVAMDPLSIMDGYLTRLRKKSKNLASTLLFLNGKKIELERIIDKKRKEYEEFTKLALAAKQQNIMSSAQSNATKALACQKSVELYTPMYNKYISNTEKLGEVQENWLNTIDTLSYTIDSKREEFQTLRSMYKGLKSVEDMLSNGSPEAQLFAESLKALEADVSQKLSYVEDFEKRAKPILTDMKVQKQADANDAMSLLENLVRDNNLKLPNYQTFTPILNSKIEDISYIEVKNKYKL
jgi:hypothetical protein